MSKPNPFELVDTEDGRWYAARNPEGRGPTVYEESDVHTLIAIHDVRGASDVLNHVPGHVSGPWVAKLPGLWEPEQGTIIQVGEPNRDVTVTDVRYQVDAAGFSAIVYVSDPERDTAI